MRMIHACGMTDIVGDLRISADFVAAGLEALAASRSSPTPRWCGTASSHKHRCQIICTLNDPRARDLGSQSKPRAPPPPSNCGQPHLEGAVAVIGNAPTALFALLEMIDAGGPRPAAIVAFPVGFVGAAEAKDELVGNPRGIPFATLLGRRGGSAMAAAGVNALVERPHMTKWLTIIGMGEDGHDGLSASASSRCRTPM